MGNYFKTIGDILSDVKLHRFFIHKKIEGYMIHEYKIDDMVVISSKDYINTPKVILNGLIGRISNYEGTTHVLVEIRLDNSDSDTLLYNALQKVSNFYAKHEFKDYTSFSLMFSKFNIIPYDNNIIMF